MSGVMRGFRYTHNLFNHGGYRRQFGYEGEGPVFVDGDDGRDEIAFLFLGLVVILFDKVHDGNTMLAECGAYGRSRGSFTGGKGGVENGFYFFWARLFLFFL